MAVDKPVNKFCNEIVKLCFLSGMSHRKWTKPIKQHIIVLLLNFFFHTFPGYKGYIHPGVTHEFQSAAMRFGHTLVPPGVYRRWGNLKCYQAPGRALLLSACLLSVSSLKVSDISMQVLRGDAFRVAVSTFTLTCKIFKSGMHFGLGGNKFYVTYWYCWLMNKNVEIWVISLFLSFYFVPCNSEMTNAISDRLHLSPATTPRHLATMVWGPAIHSGTHK